MKRRKKRGAKRHWLRWLLLGVVFSWAVALVHWFLSQTGMFPANGYRLVMEGQYSGLSTVDAVLDRLRFGLLKPKDGFPYDVHLHGYSYGWPIRSLGVVIEETRGPTSPTSARIFAGCDLGRWWPRPANAPIDFHVVPLFPLVTQSLLSGLMYGAALWLTFARRRWLEQRSARLPCARCGYELDSLSEGTRRPECGANA